MNKYLSIFLLFSSVAFAQMDSIINGQLNMPKALHEKEIRIYRKVEITNHASFFRLYQDEDKSWQATLYNFNFAWEESGNDAIDSLKITFKTDPSYTWQEILMSDVLELPTQDKFKYKLKGKSSIEKDRAEYGIIIRKKVILDGESFQIHVRDGSQSNAFEFDNPREYFKLYPSVDELNSLMQLLAVLEKEFGIWK